MKKRKGFSLIEVLVVIVILSILTTTVIAAVSGYIKNGKESYDDKLESSFLLAGKNYYADNTEKLPEKGGSEVVSLAELRSLNFVNKDFIDAYGNKCSNEDSLVMVANENGKYEYKACLYCEGSAVFNEDHSEFCDRNSINLSDEKDIDDEEKEQDENVNNDNEAQTCKIIKKDEKYIVYSSTGEKETREALSDAVTKLLNDSCRLTKKVCSINSAPEDIKYYYGKNGKIYESAEAAQNDGTCEKVCFAYEVKDIGLDSSYIYRISTKSKISNKATLKEEFTKLNKTLNDSTYYLHYMKKTAYDEIISSSNSSSKATPTSGTAADKSEYKKKESGTKLSKSVGIFHKNANIPDDYELALGKAVDKSKVTIGKSDKLTKEEIKAWGSNWAERKKEIDVTFIKYKGYQNENYKVRYYNVGKYNGKKIDVEMILVKADGCTRSGNGKVCGVGFGGLNTHIISLGVNAIHVKYKFYEANTNKAISVKGYNTYWDIDANQGIHYVKGITGLYFYGTSKLHYRMIKNAPYLYEYDKKIYEGKDSRVAVTETFSGSEIYKVFTFRKPLGGSAEASNGEMQSIKLPIGVSKEYKGSTTFTSVLHKDDIVKFTIRYANTTSSAKTVTITDHLSSNMEYVKKSATYNGGAVATPIINGNKVIWKKKVSAYSGGSVTYQVKIKSCGFNAKSHATLNVGGTTYYSQTLKNAVLCTDKKDTECATYIYK